jgi:hypothetical protein
LTLAFSRHIIEVASEYKNYPEAENEQKQKFEQKTLHKKRPFLAGGRFYIIRLAYPTIKPDHYVIGCFRWWSWRVLPPRPNGN